THESNSFPNSHLNTYYSPPSQIHQENNTTHSFETPPSFPYNTHTNPCDYIPPATDEIEVLKAKIDAFTRMAKEDTAKLKAEIKSELKDYLATLREEGLPLEEVETKMLSMMEELMKMNESRANSTIIDDIPTLEAHPRIVQEVEKENASGEESFEEKVDCYARVLEEVPIFELENQKEVEMESEDEDIEVVLEDEESTCGNIIFLILLVLIFLKILVLNFLLKTLLTLVWKTPL
ncbi:hypothetical protein ABN226_18525, partial [Morganella morganii]|uniref:hypothetical protein n=1 Tax=Morganella morganii TaxID=582 RepID=UPI0032DBAF2A